MPLLNLFKLAQESPMLELANDYFRFVTGYFEVIRASSMHIYHSALLSAPKNSVVQKLYRSHTSPLIRVVHGVPISWDTNAAAITRPSEIYSATLSPCNRFIAILWCYPETMEILDAVTLQKLQTLQLPFNNCKKIWKFIFSPEGQISTCVIYEDWSSVSVVNWDLQTGGVINTIKHQVQGANDNLITATSIAYSADGKIGVYCHRGYSRITEIIVVVYDITTGSQPHFHQVSTNHWTFGSIWAQEEFLQFTTLQGMDITIWEVGFASDAVPVQIETLPIPGDFVDDRFLVRHFPTPCRLILASMVGVTVWDPQSSKPLLSCTDLKFDDWMTFSSDGHLFACATLGSEISLWKESPTGYVLYAKPQLSTRNPNLLLSPNGESITAFGGRMVWSWHMEGLSTHPSSYSTQAIERTEKFLQVPPWNFIMDFSPDKVLAVTARQGDNMVMVLNLQSGVLQSTINVDSEVYGLWVNGDTVNVVCHWKVITWNLSTGYHVPSVKMGLEGSPWTRDFDSFYPHYWGNHINVSISPNFHHIATTSGQGAYIYNASTGMCLAQILSPGSTLWFPPDGQDLWSVMDNGQAFVQRSDDIWDGGNVIAQCVRLKEQHAYGWQYDKYDGTSFGFNHPPKGFPWASSFGYQVTNDWWILSPDGKRLLMLPPPWQSPYTMQRVWKGHIVALLHCELPEPVILDLNVQY